MGDAIIDLQQRYLLFDPLKAETPFRHDPNPPCQRLLPHQINGLPQQGSDAHPKT